MSGKDEKRREELHSRWEGAYGHALSADDIREITTNLSDFVRLLLEWQGDSSVLDESALLEVSKETR